MWEELKDQTSYEKHNVKEGLELMYLGLVKTVSSC
jgi:hypothetical protein